MYLVWWERVIGSWWERATGLSLETKNQQINCSRVATCFRPGKQKSSWTRHVVYTRFLRFNRCFRDLESGVIGCCEIHGPIIALPSQVELNTPGPLPKGRKHWHDCPELHKAVEGAAFIADYIKKEEEEKKVNAITRSRCHDIVTVKSDRKNGNYYINNHCYSNIIFRSKKIGNTSRWCWTGYSCGYLH